MHLLLLPSSTHFTPPNNGKSKRQVNLSGEKSDPIAKFRFFVT